MWSSNTGSTTRASLVRVLGCDRLPGMGRCSKYARLSRHHTQTCVGRWRTHPEDLYVSAEPTPARTTVIASTQRHSQASRRPIASIWSTKSIARLLFAVGSQADGCMPYARAVDAGCASGVAVHDGLASAVPARPIRTVHLATPIRTAKQKRWEPAEQNALLGSNETDLKPPYYARGPARMQLCPGSHHSSTGTHSLRT